MQFKKEQQKLTVPLTAHSVSEESIPSFMQTTVTGECDELERDCLYMSSH